SEIFRAGRNAVSGGQSEAAADLGLSPWQIFTFIVWPQMFARIIQPLIGQSVILVKESSVLSIITVGELTNTAMAIANQTYAMVEIYSLMAIVYWGIAIGISRLGNKIERDYAIEINSLNKYYGENHVLRGINVSITPGEVICVIGGSGSGKSTLLRCINFLEDYSSGSIVVNGECVGYEPLSGEKRRRLSDKENRKALRDVCMVFQQFNLWPHMTVL
ncbi:ATP-binding cassette domain-containing protein, partial [Klebsiella pneumoniae]|uniref:ATP-binding cassette domain-containing protein n=1 Tax=Klebsiella pneumoniae TaxID=573 RepID=UPI0021668D85